MAKKAKKEKENLEQKLKERFEAWDMLREYGCSDPFWDDSVNMNLVRNHIIYYKSAMEAEYGEDWGKYPEIYFRDTPPETRRGYIARAAEIRDKAVEVLDTYLADENFRYLLCNRELISKKEAKEIHIDNVLGYASGLADALKEDDLIGMRRHTSHPESYQQSFAACAEKVKQILSEMRSAPEQAKEDQQITLFQLGLDIGQCR